MTTTKEINSTIEMFVNSIYDDPNSGWDTASLNQWIEAIYGELATWKTYEGFSYHSNENRFESKQAIIFKIKPLLIKRLNELKSEGYAIAAI